MILYFYSPAAEQFYFDMTSILFSEVTDFSLVPCHNNSNFNRHTLHDNIMFNTITFDYSSISSFPLECQSPEIQDGTC